MPEPLNNYPLSTYQNDSIPFDIARPSTLHIQPAAILGVPIVFGSVENNVVCVYSDVRFYVSANPSIQDFADMTIPGSSPDVYMCLPGYSHVLALPAEVYIFAESNAPSDRIYIQELVRWAALGGQVSAYEVS